MSDTIASPAATGADQPEPPRPARRVLRTATDAFLRRREASVLLVAIGLVVYFQASTPIFLTTDNLRNIAQATAPTAIVAVGIVLLLVSGEIDVSVGMVAALAPYLMHYAIDLYSIPAIPAILLALVIAAGIGFVNGFITIRLKVPSFVTTLGTFYLLYGVLLTTSHAYPVAIPEPTKGNIQTWLGAGDWATLAWCLLVVAIFHIVLTQTRWGLHTISVGGNPLGATEAGIRATRVKTGNFMIVSVLGAFAGLLEAFRINSIDPNIGGGTRITFTAIAAAVIGGTALAGGSGTVIGALLGMLVLAELQNGFNLLGISANSFFLIQGIAILASMIANQYLSRLRRAGRT
ncbi:ABC transporter permease [Phytohabitans aurantiacus]|jgi:simple sugar transport system permease protein|uniref:Sugar ABC transporter permease n=1 Tax=Phytohabitans aurantiacus TaxID=3016789 RepID=A0ABQ5R9V5_9ACTN|nr:ABC transporter permease [Phytohabitans aurantiacus]GLI03549.1 sugar ABC transporter permease [Phytohabitans aurantiacus]